MTLPGAVPAFGDLDCLPVHRPKAGNFRIGLPIGKRQKLLDESTRRSWAGCRGHLHSETLVREKSEAMGIQMPAWCHRLTTKFYMAMRL